MIVAAAACPSPPLLAGALTGQADILPELRAACAAAVARLLAAAPDMVVVAGSAEATACCDPARRLSLAFFAPALRAGGPQQARQPPSDDSERPGAGAGAGPAVAAPSLPLALGLGALLLDEAGYRGPRVLQGIADDEPAAGCLALGRLAAAVAPRVALLAVGDGSARRSESAPGYLDERAAPFDEAVERAFRDADLAALAALDPALATELLAAGRPAWQFLAGALSAPRPAGAAGGSGAVEPASAPRPPGAAVGSAQPDPAASRLQTEILYSDAPLGVAYLVATLIPR